MREEIAGHLARPLVYIAGPYTSPDPCINTNRAIKVADEITDVCVPLIPHLSHFWHTMSPQPYAFWTDMDFVFLSRCDALLRFPGDSPGADDEVAAAERWSIPVFHTELALREWIETRQKPADATQLLVRAAQFVEVFTRFDSFVRDAAIAWLDDAADVIGPIPIDNRAQVAAVSQ